MALANFSLPYQATPSPFLFQSHRAPEAFGPSPDPGRSAPLAYDDEGNDEESYDSRPYSAPAYYRQRQAHRARPLPQASSARTETRFPPGLGSGDFERTQPRRQPDRFREPLPPREQLHPQQQTQQPLQQLQQQQRAVETPRDDYPGRPDGYTRVNGAGYGGPDAKTSVHAVLDYDADGEGDAEFEDYLEDNNRGVPRGAHVTPIQGPIFLKNGTVPVVPLFSYPQLNNGTFVQIPILWTALSVALGVELRGDLVRGAPCIKRYHQLFCPTAGNTYPIERIERFIDENKALMRRMYGDFEMSEGEPPPPRDPGASRRRRDSSSGPSKHDLPDGGPGSGRGHQGSGDSYFGHGRSTRQAHGSGPTPANGPNSANAKRTGRVDACESKVEIVTPYWASNSAGKIRAIVNTQHFEQAIHQEVCSKTQTNRCNGDCGCEQKYKWHRLLAYDPDNDCKGIFMDWFLFPSCCVCRCEPTSGKFATSSSSTYKSNP
ncbi:protein spaetzle 3 [Orussus abietinus]|uniref:protein spaetzle 3 n=1 Tax=Orussus abietinus TaxID=222816 RepID=UPI000626A33F|nr:protein spaetzle 3 [Orussus abietinus]